MRRLIKANRRGFSLIQLIIGMVIIGLLAGAAMISSRDYADRARSTVLASDIQTVQAAVELYRVENGMAVPVDAEGRIDFDELVPDYIRNAPAGLNWHDAAKVVFTLDNHGAVEARYPADLAINEFTAAASGNEVTVTAGASADLSRFDVMVLYADNGEREEAAFDGSKATFNEDPADGKVALKDSKSGLETELVDVN